jgi:predicted negative regulator of RcsB-dependent stress response
VGAAALALFGWLGWRAWRQRELATGRAAAVPHRGEG